MTFNCIVKCILDGYNNNKKKLKARTDQDFIVFKKKKKLKLKIQTTQPLSLSTFKTNAFTASVCANSLNADFAPLCSAHRGCRENQEFGEAAGW